MLMNMKSNSKVGKAITETASIAYTGELLPAGSLPDVTKRYLKNSGKDKTPALVESGQGKFFNGTGQYIPTGITPNQAEGTLVTRFTYATGMVSRYLLGSFSSGTDKYIIGFNANGKLSVAFSSLGTTSATAEITYTFVNNQSYHIAVKWIGKTAYIFINAVLIKSYSYSGDTAPTAPMFLGAYNGAGTPSGYFNNVIDETYYYDVALPDTAIQALYLHPEKVKSYNGAIVPDIGSEANCKLFLPMCENSGSDVVNVAVAPTEITQNSGFDTDTWWLKVIGATISGGKANFNITNSNYGGVYQNVALNIGNKYQITFTVTDYTSGGVSFKFAGTTTVASPVYSAVGTYSVILVPVIGNNQIYFYANSGGNFVGSIDNVSVKEITAYPIASWTTTCNTSAAKLSYGAQCTAWKRDSLGVLLGMSNGLSTDRAISIKAPTTPYTPLLTDDFAFAYTVLVNGVTRETLGSSTGTVLSKINANNTISKWVFNISISTPAVANGYHRTAVKYNGTTKRYSVYIDGVLAISSATDATTSTGVAIVLFRSDNQLQAYPRIWEPAQISKFDPVKDYQASLKYVTKLGA